MTKRIQLIPLLFILLFLTPACIVSPKLDCPGGIGQMLDYSARYCEMVTKKIYGNWEYENGEDIGIKDNAVLTLTLGLDGQLQKTEFKIKSPYPALNHAALKAVEKSKPFPPPPCRNVIRRIEVIFLPKIINRYLASKSPPKTVVDDAFTRYTNGVIFDSRTNLEWYIGPEKCLSFEEAEKYASSLSIAGGRWRMPSLSELNVLYQKEISPIHLNPLFQTYISNVWSSEKKEKKIGETIHSWSWFFDFHSGEQKWTNSLCAIAFAVRNKE